MDGQAKGVSLILQGDSMMPYRTLLPMHEKQLQVLQELKEKTKLTIF